MQDGALLNIISALDEANNETLIPRDQLDVPVTRIAAVLLKAKLEQFSQQKSNKVENHSFRNDQLCMLVLSGYIITDILQNLKNLLFYKNKFAILDGLLLQTVLLLTQKISQILRKTSFRR